MVKPGTSEIVGSQDELLFAYKDVQDVEVLNLDLKLFKTSKKRKSTPDEESDSQPQFRHEGRWSNAEEELFSMGVDQHGWRMWKEIAGVIGTRDREQVRKFAGSLRGSQYKKKISVTPGLLDLAEGMRLVAQSLHTTQEQEESK